MKKNISVNFAEYESPSFDQQVASLSVAINNKLIDLDTALEMLYPNKTEDERNTIKLNILNIKDNSENNEENNKTKDNNNDDLAE